MITGTELEAAGEIARPYVPVTPAYRWPLLEAVTGTPRSGICANIAARDLLGRRTEVVGVVAERAPAHALSFEAGRPVTTPSAGTFVDGVATRVPDKDAVAVMVRGAARFVQVSEECAEEAMRTMWQTTHQMPEPSGALALAGLLADTARPAGTVAAVIMTGGNCDREYIQHVVVRR